MTRKARIVAGVVNAISYAIDDKAEDSRDWIEVPDDVFAGYLANSDGTFSPPPPSPPSADPSDYDLEKWQFFMVLGPDGLNIEDNVRTRLKALPAGPVRGTAVALFENSRTYSFAMLDVEPFATIKAEMIAAGELDAATLEATWIAAAKAKKPGS